MGSLCACQQRPEHDPEESVTRELEMAAADTQQTAQQSRFFENGYPASLTELIEQHSQLKSSSNNDHEQKHKDLDDVSEILSHFPSSFIDQINNYIVKNLQFFTDVDKLNKIMNDAFNGTSIYSGLGGICIVLLRLVQILDEYQSDDKKSNHQIQRWHSFL